MKKWICLLLALAMLGCFALAENTIGSTNSVNTINDKDPDGDGNYLVAEGALFDSVGVRIGVAAVIALIIAFVRVNAMKAKLQTAHSVSGAANYAEEGSFELSVKQDHFLYERTDRRRIQTSQGAASGGSRGSGGGTSRGGGANRLR